MDLQLYLAPIRKWWWLVLAAAVVGFLASALILSQRPPTYQARAALMIGRSVLDPNPTSAQLGLGERLADTYAALARRDPVQNATMAALGLTELPEYETRPIPEAQLVEILVIDTSPVRAQAVANEIANQVILLSPTGPLAAQEGRQLFINEQLNFLQASILDVQGEMAAQQEGLVGLTSAVEIARAQDALAALQAKLTALQSNYATLLANSEGGAVNYLTLIEPASLPDRPLGPGNLLLALLAGLAGAVLGGSTAYLLEYMDTSLKTPEEAVRLLRIPIIGMIGEIKSPGRPSGKPGSPVVSVRGQPAVIEALRILWTNLEFASVDRPLRTLLVASPGPDEGKTTIAVNLASAMAQSGKRVALIDADLRRPAVHSSFDVPAQPGLSDVFLGRKQTADIVTPRNGGNLLVIPAGTPPPNPTELLARPRLGALLSGLETRYDIILLDTAPSQLTSDFQPVAARAGGMLIAVRRDVSRLASLAELNEKITHTGAQVVGAVVLG